MPADSLAHALRLYADIIRRPHLPEDQLDDARQVSMQELMSVEDDPTQQVMIRLKQLQYGHDRVALLAEPQPELKRSPSKMCNSIMPIDIDPTER